MTWRDGLWPLPSPWTRRRAHRDLDTPQTACPQRRRAVTCVGPVVTCSLRACGRDVSRGDGPGTVRVETGAVAEHDAGDVEQAVSH